MPLFARGGKNRMNLSLSFSLLRLQEVLEGVNECKRSVSVLSLLLPFLVTVDFPLLFRAKSFTLPYHQVGFLKERPENALCPLASVGPKQGCRMELNTLPKLLPYFCLFVLFRFIKFSFVTKCL